MSISLSKHAKYTPKHRIHKAPSRPTKVLRNSVLYSSVAVAATGVAVSGGVLSSSADSPVNVAADFPKLGAGDDVRTDLVRRAPIAAGPPTPTRPPRWPMSTAPAPR